MYFDWVTWSIWLIGFVIMIIWIMIPAREFRRLVQKKKLEMRERNLRNNKASGD